MPIRSPPSQILPHTQSLQSLWRSFFALKWLAITALEKFMQGGVSYICFGPKYKGKYLQVRRHFAQYLPADIALCSVVKAELLFGVMNSEKIERNLQLLHKLFAPIQSFNVDDHAAEHYAQIRDELTAKGKLIDANDLMIAAIVRANDATLITHNTNEFQRVNGLSIEDWET